MSVGLIEALSEKMDSGLKVEDAIQLRLSNFPLDYHLHSWSVTKMLPYFKDKCAAKAEDCHYLNEYLEFSFAKQEEALDQTYMTENDFHKWWSKEVFIMSEGKLEPNELYNVYVPEDDIHDSENKTRAIWKYGAAKGVSGTPTAFINGVQLDTFPATSDAWLELLNSLQAVQWPSEEISNDDQQCKGYYGTDCFTDDDCCQDQGLLMCTGICDYGPIEQEFLH